MAQEQWYMAIGGHQVGPVSQDDVVTSLRNGTIDGTTLVFTAGLSNWTSLKDVPQLAAFLSANRATQAPPPQALVAELVVLSEACGSQGTPRPLAGPTLTLPPTDTPAGGDASWSGNALGLLLAVAGIGATMLGAVASAVRISRRGS